MTQEEKQSLLKDICARLPYGVKVCARFNTGNRYTADVTAISADRDYIQTRQNDLHPYTGSSVEDIRPYLRPMSSMTDEEGKELEHIFSEIDAPCWVDTKYGCVSFAGGDFIDAEIAEVYTDWLNKNHFDYRGLIPMGLALEAPEDMYKAE